MPLDISADKPLARKTAPELRNQTDCRCPQELPESELVACDEMSWYPIRVTYCREMRLKLQLDDAGIENYIPMQYKEAVVRGRKRRVQVPAVHNIVFIRTSRGVLQDFKEKMEDTAPMRYMMERTTRRPIVVPDKQMTDFIRVTSDESENYIFLENHEFAARPGERVRITEGIFKGVEGKVLRVKGNKKVVVSIEGVAAVAIQFVPASYLEKIN